VNPPSPQKQIGSNMKVQVNKNRSTSNDNTKRTAHTPSYSKPFQTKPTSKSSSLRNTFSNHHKPQTIVAKTIPEVPEFKPKESLPKDKPEEIEQKLDLIFD
jgi:hypothetical protein